MPSSPPAPTKRRPKRRSPSKSPRSPMRYNTKGLISPRSLRSLPLSATALLYKRPSPKKKSPKKKSPKKLSIMEKLLKNLSHI